MPTPSAIKTISSMGILRALRSRSIVRMPISDRLRRRRGRHKERGAGRRAAPGQRKTRGAARAPGFSIGRSKSDSNPRPLLPKQVRYQAALYSVKGCWRGPCRMRVNCCRGEIPAGRPLANGARYRLGASSGSKRGTAAGADWLQRPGEPSKKGNAPCWASPVVRQRFLVPPFLRFRPSAPASSSAPPPTPVYCIIDRPRTEVSRAIAAFGEFAVPAAGMCFVLDGFVVPRSAAARRLRLRRPPCGRVRGAERFGDDVADLVGPAAIVLDNFVSREPLAFLQRWIFGWHTIAPA